jgi:hypothetical protein
VSAAGEMEVVVVAAVVADLSILIFSGGGCDGALYRPLLRQ